MRELPPDVKALLPPAYVIALEAFAAGESDDDVAARIGVDPAAVRAAVRLATAKLLDATSEVGATRRRD